MGFDPISLLAEGAALFSSVAAPSAAAVGGVTAGVGAGADAALTSGLAAGAGTAAASSSILPYLAYGSTALSGLGGVVGAVGAKNTAEAQAKSAEYQAQVNAQNTKLAEANAGIASQAGEAQAGIQGQRGKAQVGAILAAQGASGIDPYTGSARDVRQSASDLSQLNALTVRSEAIKQAYGYQTQGKSFETQATLGNYEASEDREAGTINAASTFLGGASSAADKFSNWQLTSGKSLSL